MWIFARKNRVASGAIFLSLVYCHVTTLAAISMDASSGKALSSTGSGTSGGSRAEDDPCGVIPRTGCTADRVLPHPSGMSRLLEKRSIGESLLSEIPPEVFGGSSADDSEGEDESGGFSTNRPGIGNRMLWNVPFRMPYGDEEDKRKFMFGKRNSSEEEDKIRNVDQKRSGGKEKNTRKFKFGKKRRTEDTGSELDDNPETGYDGRLDTTAMTSSGSKTPDLDRSEGSSSVSGGGRSKRKFKFGKKSDPSEEKNSFQEEEEEEENEEEMEEEKRKVMFGKREDDGDSGDSVEWKRRAKFQFGKRYNGRVYPYEVFPKLKTKFKLGK